MSIPQSPVKRVSSRTPKLSAKMIALEEEVNLKRRKTLEAAKSTTVVTASTTAVAAAAMSTSTAGNQLRASTTGAERISTVTGNVKIADVKVAPFQSVAPTPSTKPKTKGAPLNSSQSSSLRNRKRKSGIAASALAKSGGSGSNSSGPRKNKNGNINSAMSDLDGTALQPATIVQLSQDPFGTEGSAQMHQQVNFGRTLASATGRGASLSKSFGAVHNTHRNAASRSSNGSGRVYEENELDVTQFTTDGGGGCSSSQQLLVVDDTSESTISMMSLGVTSGSSGLLATPINRTGGSCASRESKKKKFGSSGKKLQENNASEDEAEEKWLMAIEAGKLEEDAELRSMKDPALMTARQRAVVEAKQARVEHLQHIQALHEAWKDQAAAELLSSEVMEKRAQKAAKRRRLAEEKRDKEKKDTIKRLLKKADSRQKAKKLQRNKAQMVAKVSYRYTYDGMTVSFPLEIPPSSLGIDLTPRKAQRPTPVLCSNVGCANLKRYQCSVNGLPVCSLQCYRQVSLLPPLAQLLESASGSQDGTKAANDSVKVVPAADPVDSNTPNAAPIEATMGR
ncbi:hypothetical protein BIW11_11088 [Tropilaelaps mercedesae]|uniref:INO80 complex subunit B-like conserved region domain-containing protein n=1 Tax=Tropilaelaps mercedesae TaxID=418985 RepID=A0A1V9XD72_9ACAR|nr:hypothetical protein BIW11_11088 [Tropilaelaps mercedesae]